MDRRIFAFTLSIFLIACSVAHSQIRPKRDVALLIDNSGSMFSQIDRQRGIAKALLAKVGTDSTISLFGFATVPKSDPLSLTLAAGAECSTEIQTVESQLDSVKVARGQTALIDSLVTVADQITKSSNSGCSKEREKLLILTTDGEDRSSVTRPNFLIEKMKELKVKAYVVAILDDLSSDRGFLGNSPKKKATEFLTDLAKETNGRLVVAKKKMTAVEIVDTLFAEKYVFPN